MTKIDIFSGFLGAGKTTLIKKLIKEAYNGEKLALIENEFGEIGVDGIFLKDSGINITEMNSGCICCSLVGEFGKALNEVISKYSPDRIIIEPSGVGKLSDIIKAVKNADLHDKDGIDAKINNFIDVIDATKCKVYIKNFKEFYIDQLKNAKTIILSRTQKMNEEKLKETINIIREINDKANLVTTPWDYIDGSDILKSMEMKNTFEDELLKEAIPTSVHDEDKCLCHHHYHEHEHEHHHHHADEVFNSIGFQTIHKYTKSEIENILKEISNADKYGMVLRAKGMVQGENEWIYFDLVPEEYEIRSGKPDVIGKICVIGTKVNEGDLKKLFNII